MIVGQQIHRYCVLLSTGGSDAWKVTRSKVVCFTKTRKEASLMVRELRLLYPRSFFHISPRHYVYTRSGWKHIVASITAESEVYFDSVPPSHLQADIAPILKKVQADIQLTQSNEKTFSHSSTAAHPIMGAPPSFMDQERERSPYDPGEGEPAP